MLWPARLVGAATAVYSAAVLARPEILAKPTGLTGPGSAVDVGTAVLTRGIGARDLVSGLAMALAPTASGVRLAGLVRIGADLGDAIGMGSSLPDEDARRKAAAVAGGWGALTLLALWLARGD